MTLRSSRSALRDKLHETLHERSHLATRNEAESCFKSLQKVERCSTFRNGFCNLSRNGFGRCKLCNVSCNFSRNGVARQVARKIAQSDSAFSWITRFCIWLIGILTVTQKCLLFKYSGALPYGRLVITPTLFRPEQKLSQLFSYSKNPSNTATPLTRPDFLGPLVTGLTGFHCTCLWMAILILHL